MTDKEIIRALECHDDLSFNRNACERCPILNHIDCGHKLAGNALALINRQQAKIEALQMDNRQLQSDIINANCNGDQIALLFEEEKKECDRLRAEIEKIHNLAEQGNKKLYETLDYRAEKITELESEIEKLEKENENLKEQFHYLDVECCRLEKENERLISNLEAMAQSMPTMAKAERAEAVKEFAERLKKETIYATNKEIDNLVKEMVGE